MFSDAICLTPATFRWLRPAALLALGSALVPALAAQTFSPIPALSFVKAYEGANPLPQVITVNASPATSFSVTTTSMSGGNWLIASASGCCASTPNVFTLSATPSNSLAAGTYTGKVVIAQANGPATQTIPVTLTIQPANQAFLDNLPGQVSFSLLPGGSAPPKQTFEIRNGGSGTLSWTSSVTTSDGGKWLSLSSTSGTSPSSVSAAIDVAALPGQGELAGTYIGEIAIHSSSGSVTLPVSVTVGDSVFRQVNALDFNKIFADTQDPLPQTVTIASTGSPISFGVSAYTASGGNWLSVGVGCCSNTPDAIVVSVTPSSSLAAGVYTGEILIYQSGSSMAMTIPVTLRIEPSPATGPFFDSLPGQVSFSLQTDAPAPPTQPIQIRNAGTGTLSWTAGGSTSDGGAWISLSASSGTAPSTVAVGVIPSALPGAGKLAGTYVGQLLLQSSSGSVTIPVSVTVGDSVFRQVNALDFNKVFADTQDPLPQTVTIASTDLPISFGVSAYTSGGGNWLSVGVGCCSNTPDAIVVSVTPSSSLAAGVYTGEIVVYQSGSSMAMTIPVTLTIEASPATGPFFDSLPGQVSFSLQTDAPAPPTQPIQIRNAGTGTLSWTASTSTSDGGAWISLSASSGTAPSTVAVGVIPSALPGAGKLAGTYVGQLLLQSSSGSITIPVSVTVGDSVFRQVNALDFNKVFADTQNPLPQTITIASTDLPISFGVSAYTSGGGNWLSVGVGCCSNTPDAIVVSVTPSSSLAAGVYTGEIVVYQSGSSMAMTIPVTLTISATNNSAFGDVQGQASFFLQPNATKNPPSQSIRIRNAGTGTLDWTASASTSDGANWVTLSATSGSAPASLSVGVSLAALPGQGKLAGTYTGLVRIASSTQVMTVPVSLVIGANVFEPVPAVIFSKPTGTSSVPSQSISVSSTGTPLSFGVSYFSGRGGNWLIVNANGCCASTPTPLTLSVDPSVNLPNGVYAAEVVIYQSNSQSALTVPVYYTVGPAPTSITLQSSLNPAPQGQAVTLTATVNDFGSVVGGTVAFKDGSTTLATIQLTNGVANYTTSTLPVGTDALTAVYSGTGAFASSTSQALSQVINPTVSSTKTVVVTSLDPSVAGASLQLVATVTSAVPKLTGTVTFKNGTVTLGTVTLTGGTASYTTAALPAGSHSITAIYNGDASHPSSTSPAVTQVVLWPTATKLAASANPETAGQFLTLTATVSASSSGVSGYVTFFDGATAISTVPVIGGAAVLKTSALTKATHVLSAIYGGNADFAGSVSAAINETIN